MATWNSRGLRGSTFENLINSTNEYYRKAGLALVQKIPTPIVPLKFDSEKKLITEAYFEKDSTVDYIGVVQEIPICFDAKECHTLLGRHPQEGREFYEGIRAAGRRIIPAHPFHR